MGCPGKGRRRPGPEPAGGRLTPQLDLPPTQWRNVDVSPLRLVAQQIGHDLQEPVGRAIRNSRLKEWEAFQLGNDDWFVRGAVYSAKVLGLLYLAAVHWPTGKIHRWFERVPGWRLRVASGLDGTTSAGQTEKLRLSVENRLPGEGITAKATFTGDDERPAMGLEVLGHGAVGEAGHLVICHPFSESRALYSNKAVMAADGEMNIAGSTIGFEPARSFMILDDHKGDYPFPMKYDWVTGARIESDGRRIGFNLTQNQALNPEVFNENAVFINDRVHRLGAVRFSRPHGVNSTWTVRDSAHRRGRLAGDGRAEAHPRLIAGGGWAAGQAPG